MGIATACRCALLLAWVPLAASLAQSSGVDVGLEALQQERKRLREVPLGESLDGRVEALAVPPPVTGFFVGPLLQVRLEVAAFNGGLARADKLSRAQMQRLSELLKQARRLQLPLYDETPTDDVQQPGLAWLSERYRSVESAEQRLRDRELQADVILAQLPQFLTPLQVRAFARQEADALNEMRRQVAELRSAAGLPEDMPRPAVPPTEAAPF